MALEDTDNCKKAVAELPTGRGFFVETIEGMGRGEGFFW